jgi:hypothetical protein
MKENALPKKWSKDQRKVFRYVYKEMLGNQSLFLHPKAVEHSKEFWGTTAWNAAWIAAEAMDSL